MVHLKVIFIWEKTIFLYNIKEWTLKWETNSTSFEFYSFLVIVIKRINSSPARNKIKSRPLDIPGLEETSVAAIVVSCNSMASRPSDREPTAATAHAHEYIYILGSVDQCGVTR